MHGRNLELQSALPRCVLVSRRGGKLGLLFEGHARNGRMAREHSRRPQSAKDKRPRPGFWRSQGESNPCFSLERAAS
jgi:hypothetical protein